MLFLGADCVHAHLQCLSCLNVKLLFCVVLAHGVYV